VDADRLVAEAKALAASDIVLAIRKLHEARAQDPEVAGAVELEISLAEQARLQGERALTLAKNFDAGGREADAIREYERAVRLLELVPGGHKDLSLARQRLARLKR
jgi:hypothetical protein